MVDSIKITALQDIGANIAYTTLVPLVNMAGTPTTQKSNLQNLGNLILNGAGGSYFPRAAQANLALSVANAAQPNITSLGTLTSLAVTGNITAGNINGGNIVVANFYYGDGGFLTNVASGSNYSNSNVANYLPTYEGNVGAGNVNVTGTVYANGISSTGLASLTTLNVSTTANLGAVGNVRITGGNPGQLLATDGVGNLSWVNDPSGVYNNSNVANYLPTFTGTVGANKISSGNLSGSNLEISANGAVFTFGQGGALYWPAIGGGQKVIETNSDGEFEIKSTTNVVISTDISNANSHFTFAGDGAVYCPANAFFEGTRLNVGPGAGNVPLATNPTLVVTDTGLEFIQTALINQSSNGSSDYAAYGAGSDETQGFADFGFAGHTFNDPNYTVTLPGDGYILTQGYANGIGGALVLATGEKGNVPDIIFATGGFMSSNEFARIDHANNMFHLTRANSGIQFYDGTIQTTAGGGGSTGNVTFNNQVVIGTGDEYGGGGLYLAPGTNSTANLQFLRVRGGDYPTHIHFDTGNNEYYDQYFGADSKYVKLEANGNVIINADDYVGNSATWSFTTDGHLTAPGNVYIGPGANANGLADALLVLSSNSTAFIQSVITNVSDVGSADWIAQGHHGNDAGGYADLGFNSCGFSDANYSATGPGDGYLLVDGFAPGQAPLPTGGNLVLGTSSQGLTKDIIFTTGGFTSANIFGRISDANNAFEFTRANSFLQFAGTGSISNPANTSLDPINPNVSTMVLTPDANYSSQALVLDPTSIGHIHLRSPGSNIDQPSANLFLGGEASSFEVGQFNGAVPNLFIHSNNNTWTFNIDGNLTLPQLTTISDESGIGTTLTVGAPPTVIVISGADVAAVNLTYTRAIGVTPPTWTSPVVNPASDPYIEFSNGEYGIIAPDYGLTPIYVNTGTLNIPVTQWSLNPPLGSIAPTAVYTYGAPGPDWVFSNAGTLFTPLVQGGPYEPSIMPSDGALWLRGLNNSSTGGVSIDIDANIAEGTYAGGIYITTGIGANANAAGSNAATGGGELNLQARNGGEGDSAYDGAVGGNIILSSGNGGNGTSTSSNAGPGGSVQIYGGGGGNPTVGGTGGLGGNVIITAGWTARPATPGATVYLSGGDSDDGILGNVEVYSNIGNWVFNGNSGVLTVPGNLVAVSASPAPSISGFSSVSALQFTNGNSNVTVNANSNLWNFDSTGNLTLPGNISGNTNGYTIGYLNIPQVAAANATLALTDAGKHYYSNTAGNFTLTVPTNANAAFATGTAISIVVQAAGNILVNAASGVTLYMAGNSTAANRVVGGYGMATLMKVATDTWFINGTGVA